MWKKFSFYLNSLEKEEITENQESSGIKYYKCFFKINNNQKVAHIGLKFQIYIYQSLSSNNEQENFIFNNSLDDKLFVEGCLSLNIPKLESNEEFNYDINIYPLKKEEFIICCVLLDKDKKEVYFCPTIINLKL